MLQSQVGFDSYRFDSYRCHWCCSSRAILWWYQWVMILANNGISVALRSYFVQSHCVSWRAARVQDHGALLMSARPGLLSPSKKTCTIDAGASSRGRSQLKDGMRLWKYVLASEMCRLMCYLCGCRRGRAAKRQRSRRWQSSHHPRLLEAWSRSQNVVCVSWCVYCITLWGSRRWKN